MGILKSARGALLAIVTTVFLGGCGGVPEIIGIDVDGDGTIDCEVGLAVNGNSLTLTPGESCQAVTGDGVPVDPGAPSTPVGGVESATAGSVTMDGTSIVISITNQDLFWVSGLQSPLSENVYVSRFCLNSDSTGWDQNGKSGYSLGAQDAYCVDAARDDATGSLSGTITNVPSEILSSGAWELTARVVTAIGGNGSETPHFFVRDAYSGVWNGAGVGGGNGAKVGAVGKVMNPDGSVTYTVVVYGTQQDAFMVEGLHKSAVGFEAIAWWDYVSDAPDLDGDGAPDTNAPHGEIYPSAWFDPTTLQASVTVPAAAAAHAGELTLIPDVAEYEASTEATFCNQSEEPTIRFFVLDRFDTIDGQDAVVTPPAPAGDAPPAQFTC